MTSATRFDAVHSVSLLLISWIAGSARVGGVYEKSDLHFIGRA